jgi:trehalose 6-phosphate phosphatase
VEEDVRDALGRLARELTVVAVITGRSMADARRLVGLPELIYLGNHGMEEGTGTGSRWEPSVEAYRPLLGRVLAAVQAIPREIPGTIVEDKGPTLSIHYRVAARPEDARARILELLDPFRDYLRVTEGKMVVEVRPPVELSKATAARRVVDKGQLRGAVFLGDDRTDVGAFAALRALRATPGGPRTLGVAVAGAGTPPDVIEAADRVVSGVDDVAALLRHLADALEGGGR